MKKTGKKGITIMELTIVLALVAIVGTMAVSFAVLFSTHTKISTARLNAMSDVELVESTTEGWMSRMALLGAEVTLVDDGETYIFPTLEGTVSGGEAAGVYTLYYHMGDGVLTGTLPGGDTLNVELKNVSTVVYDALLQPDTSGDLLCVCTVRLELPGTKNGETNQTNYTVCIDPNVGDRY